MDSIAPIRPALSCFVLAIGLCLPPAGRGEPLTEYPEIDRADASPVLVVARVRPGKYLPQFPECASPDTICMDPPPFWFRATVSSTVHGFAPPRELQVATTSHYGMSAYEDDRSQQLILLETDGRHFVMPRYARASLVEDTRGKLHLLVLRTQPTWWLPCSVAELRQEIDPRDFKEDLEINRDDFRYDVQANPGLFSPTKQGAVPRFAIPVDAIRAHLQALAPGAPQMTCKPEDPA